MMKEKFRKFSEQHEMLPEGSRVLCACSGGADSVSLLHLLRKTEGISVLCAHFNHRLRGDESDRDEAFVRELCRDLGVDCIVGSGDVAAYAASHGVGIEAAARTLRYDFLETAAEENGCTRIATAHNADDNAETILMNLIRGSGLKGLTGIPPARGKIIRPLLTVTRGEIECYLSSNGLAYVEDSSNRSDDYTRNRIRHHVLPLLREENTAAVENITVAAELLRNDEEYLSAQAESFIEEHHAERGSIPIAELLQLPRAVGSRVLLRLCPGAAKTHVDAVYSLCMSCAVHGAVDLPGMKVVKDYDVLGLNPAYYGIPTQDLPEGETLLPEAGWRIQVSRNNFCGEIHNSFNTFYFKSESICGRVCVTSRKEGDSIRLFGRGCTKTLKKLFAEAKLPLAERRRIPVLRDEAGVIAVYGFGMAERCIPQPGDAVLCVEIKEI